MIYLVSPYTSKSMELMEERYRKVCQVAAELATKGEKVYSPIAHWHPIAGMFDLPRDINFWREHDFGMIRLLPRFGVVRIDGWRESKGVGEEMKYAEAVGRNIEFFD